MKAKLFLMSMIFMLFTHFTQSQDCIDFPCEGIELELSEFYGDNCHATWELVFPEDCDFNGLEYYAQYGYFKDFCDNICWEDEYQIINNQMAPANVEIPAYIMVGEVIDVYVRLYFLLDGEPHYIKQWCETIRKVDECIGETASFSPCEESADRPPDCNIIARFPMEVCVGETYVYGLGFQETPDPCIESVTGVEIISENTATGIEDVMFSIYTPPTWGFIYYGYNFPDPGVYIVTIRIFYTTVDANGDDINTWYSMCIYVYHAGCGPSPSIENDGNGISRLYNTNGQLIKDNIDIGDWDIREEVIPSGIYFLKTEDQVEKLIK